MTDHATPTTVVEAIATTGDVNRLYREWWSGSPLDPNAAPAVAGRFTVAYHDPERWTVVDRDQTGGLTVARDGEIASVRPGEWIHSQGDNVLVRRRRRWDQNGFSWANSRRVQPPLAERWRVRVYVPGGSERPCEEFDQLIRALDDAGYWFEAKVRQHGQPWRDQCVLWITAADAPGVQRVILEALADDPHRHDPPPLTLSVGSIGLAHDPPGSASLGLLACAAVVVTRDLDGDLPIDTRWQRGCDAYGLCASHPWRHPGVDPYSTWAWLERLH